MGRNVDVMKLNAVNGDMYAQFNLGVMYYEGRGVAQDYDEAMKWRQLAEAQTQDTVKLD